MEDYNKLFENLENDKRNELDPLLLKEKQLKEKLSYINDEIIMINIKYKRKTIRLSRKCDENNLLNKKD
jgi:hypothetical protein